MRCDAMEWRVALCDGDSGGGGGGGSSGRCGGIGIIQLLEYYIDIITN